MSHIKSNRKTEVIRFRCTQKEKETIERKASRAEMPTTQYVLNAALNSRSRVRKTNEDIIRNLVQIQSDLNLLQMKIIELGMEKSELKTLVDNCILGEDELWKLFV